MSSQFPKNVNHMQRGLGCTNQRWRSWSSLPFSTCLLHSCYEPVRAHPKPHHHLPKICLTSCLYVYMDHLSFIPLTGNTSGREQQQQLVINQEYRAIKLALKVVTNIYLSQEEAIVKSSNPSSCHHNNQSQPLLHDDVLT